VGLGTATPPYQFTKAESHDWIARAFDFDRTAARIARRIVDRSGVESRWSSLADFRATGEPLLLGARSPTTSARMRAFREHAPGLAAQACRKALAAADVAPEEITHLVVVTCTGFFAPGPDIDLIDALGLEPTVARTIVGFMGCYAAFNGLRVARDAVQARPDAKALVVCVELCSLHVRPDPAPDNLVALSIFGDGAAAAVVAADDDAVAHLGEAACRVASGTRREMGWEIVDDGFRMSLSSYVPELLGAGIADFVAPLVTAGATSWCVHPGGRAILDHVEKALALAPEAMASSRGVLRDCGNMSSATILFVLERELARLAEGDRGVMLGFGPGLTLEGLAFSRGPRAVAARAVEAARVEG
jgi:predicted naringenin-chalcone synthase